MSIAVQEYTDAGRMLADYAARRARMYATAPRPVVIRSAPEPGPEAEPIDVKAEYIRNWLMLATPAALKPASHRKIIALVCDAFSISHADIVGDRRLANLVEARHVAFYLLRHRTQMSYPQIGARLGGRDHSSVINGSNRIADRLKRDPNLAKVIDTISARIQAEADAEDAA